MFEENMTCTWGPEETQMVCNNSLAAEPQFVCSVGLRQICVDLGHCMAADVQDRVYRL